jgi:hypothetical protein
MAISPFHSQPQPQQHQQANSNAAEPLQDAHTPLYTNRTHWPIRLYGLRHPSSPPPPPPTLSKHQMRANCKRHHIILLPTTATLVVCWAAATTHSHKTRERSASLKRTARKRNERIKRMDPWSHPAMDARRERRTHTHIHVHVHVPYRHLAFFFLWTMTSVYTERGGSCSSIHSWWTPLTSQPQRIPRMPPLSLLLSLVLETELDRRRSQRCRQQQQQQQASAPLPLHYLITTCATPLPPPTLPPSPLPPLLQV